MNTLSLCIRKAQRRDIEWLMRLLFELFSIESDFIFDEQKQRSGLELLLADKWDRVVYVADHDGEIVGMVTAQILVSTAAGGYSILLEDMYVKDDFRWRGIGVALVRQIKRWGFERGVTRIQLVADETNTAALTFYKKIGFRRSRMKGLYLSLIDGHKKDDEVGHLI